MEPPVGHLCPVHLANGAGQILAPLVGWRRQEARPDLDEVVAQDGDATVVAFSFQLLLDAHGRQPPLLSQQGLDEGLIGVQD